MEWKLAFMCIGALQVFSELDQVLACKIPILPRGFRTSYCCKFLFPSYLPKFNFNICSEVIPALVLLWCVFTVNHQLL